MFGVPVQTNFSTTACFCSGMSRAVPCRVVAVPRLAVFVAVFLHVVLFLLVIALVGCLVAWLTEFSLARSLALLVFVLAC